MKLEKETSSESRPPPRYADACGTAHALDLVGDRWAMLIMRELMLGPKRFGEIRAALPGISANMLSRRLAELERDLLLCRRRLDPPNAVQLYALTPWGLELEPLLCGLGRWAARSPGHDPTLPISASSLVLSLRTMFDPDKGAWLTLCFELAMEAEWFAGRVAGRRFEIIRGRAPDAELRVAGSPARLAAAIYGGAPLEDLRATGELSIQGDAQMARRLFECFVLPSKAGRPLG